jgi:hypothetical protein
LFRDTGESALFEAIVSKIWDEYDEDMSNSLHRDEVRKFLEEKVLILEKFKQGVFDEAAFDDLFDRHDKDGSGELQKHEMTDLIIEFCDAKKEVSGSLV